MVMLTPYAGLARAYRSAGKGFLSMSKEMDEIYETSEKIHHGVPMRAARLASGPVRQVAGIAHASVNVANAATSVTEGFVGKLQDITTKKEPEQPAVEAAMEKTSLEKSEPEKASALARKYPNYDKCINDTSIPPLYGNQPGAEVQYGQ